MARRRKKDISERGPDRDDAPAASYADHWYRQTDDASALSALWGWCDRLKQRQRTDNALDLIHEAMYLGVPLNTGPSQTPSLEWLRMQAASSTNAYLNVAKNLVDTAVARLGRRRPMPCISSDDASYSEKRYAQRASRVLRRKMGCPDIERMSPMALRDAVIRCTGVAYTYPKGGDVVTERIPRHEVLVDPLEAKYGETMTMARVHLVDRDKLIKRYPQHADAIKLASRASRDEWTPYEYDAPSDPDQVEMVQAWRLPTDADGDDGVYVEGIRGVVLKKGAWTSPRFPISLLHWTPPIRGFWGTGLMRDLAPLQSKVNDTHRGIQEDLYWAGSLKIFSPRSSNIRKEHLRTRHPAVIEYDGVAPQFVPGNPVSRDAMEYLRWLIQQMYELSGISQAAAQSKNPLGPNASGKALDTMYDMESDRFSHVEMQYAMFRVDIGQRILDCARMMASDEYELGDDEKLAEWITDIKWDKFDVDGGGYHLSLEPINFLPDARSGKLDTVSDLAKAGVLSDPTEVMGLFDEPDIARANRHLLGPRRMAERLCEMLADTSEPLENCTPTPQMIARADMMKQYVEGELDNAFAEGASEQEMARFEWFLEILEDGVRSATPPSPAPGMGAGAPGMPPVGGPPAPMPGAPLPPPMPGNGLGGMDAMAAAGMPLQGAA